ncbi:hypothetical protein PR048_021943 [Dryococelus australis]|uniref:Uncharacterized protein n=1 Tax=Dryococelus australis TaxID=614101 RepID=A0ABQ9GZL5_9NEOP|nr:hypothetical protein PR048_021943 [Dryococelus australis]
MAGMKARCRGWKKEEFPEKTRLRTATSATLPTRENPGDPARNRTRFALLGGKKSDYSPFTVTSNFIKALLKCYFQDVSPPHASKAPMSSWRVFEDVHKQCPCIITTDNSFLSAPAPTQRSLTRPRKGIRTRGGEPNIRKKRFQSRIHGMVRGCDPDEVVTCSQRGDGGVGRGYDAREFTSTTAMILTWGNQSCVFPPRVAITTARRRGNERKKLSIAICSISPMLLRCMYKVHPTWPRVSCSTTFVVRAWTIRFQWKRDPVNAQAKEAVLHGGIGWSR